jgi:hypothetical protein
VENMARNDWRDNTDDSFDRFNRLMDEFIKEVERGRAQPSLFEEPPRRAA